MKYTHLVMEETSAGRVITTYFETDSQVESQQVIGAAGRIKFGRPAVGLTLERKGKEIYILSVEAGAPTMLQQGDTFCSAIEASAAMGFTKYNAVSLALSTARRQQKKEATLKGVTFCLLNDIPGADRVG